MKKVLLYFALKYQGDYKKILSAIPGVDLSALNNAIQNAKDSFKNHFKNHDHFGEHVGHDKGHWEQPVA